MSFKKLFAGLAAIVALASCQKAEDPFMTLSQKSMTVEAEGGKYTFKVSANVYYRVNNDIEWAKLSQGQQVGDSTEFTLDVQENTEFKERESCIRFIGDNVTPLKLVVTQKGQVPTGVNPANIEVGRTVTSASFEVLGDKDWSITCDNAKFVCNPSKGNGNATIEVTFPVNETEDTAVANITVTMGGQNYSVKISQAGYPKKEYTDLSANGAANCYIVSKVGYYKFDATKRGNGILPDSCNSELEATIAPKSAKVLWCTYNTETAPKSLDEIICDVTVKDGFIQFQTASFDAVTSANVVIAAYDGEGCTGKIIWSWHIWICESVPAFSEIGGANWMDRNLGACCANVKGDARSCGLFYQWGRKDPLRSASTFTDGEFIATCPAYTDEMVQIMNTDGNGTIAATIANPIPFVQTTKTNKDWVFDADHKDRWMDSKKTMFDPCPVGYKVPSTTQLGAFGEAGGIPSGSQKGDAYKNAYKSSEFVFETDAWSFPLAGILSYDDGSKITDYGKVCRVVTSTYHATTAMTAWYLNCNSSACNFANAATAAHASAVRCVKE